MAEDKKWAVNIAFTGDEDTVKKIINIVENLEGEGKVGDFTFIDGPYESLQLMLKRRVENLALGVESPKVSPQSNPESQQNNGGNNSGDANE